MNYLVDECITKEWMECYKGGRVLVGHVCKIPVCVKYPWITLYSSVLSPPVNLDGGAQRTRLRFWLWKDLIINPEKKETDNWKSPLLNSFSFPSFHIEEAGGGRALDTDWIRVVILSASLAAKEPNPQFLIAKSHALIGAAVATLPGIALVPLPAAVAWSDTGYSGFYSSISRQCRCRHRTTNSAFLGTLCKPTRSKLVE